MRRLLLIVLSIVAFASAVAKDSYLPTCVAGREYIYTYNGDTIKKNTFNSQQISGYVATGYDASPYTPALRDSGSYVLRNYKDLCYHDGVLTQLKENVTTIGYDMVFFDYNMQIGDTLCVIEFADTEAGFNERHWLWGKIVKVTSIDTVEIQSSIRLKYNLESRFLSSIVGDNTDVGIPPGPDREEIYFYEILEIGEPFQEAWIEGIGYTGYITEYYGTYTLQCVHENGELIYSSEQEYIPLLTPSKYWVESAYESYVQYAMSDEAKDENGYCVIEVTEMSLPDMSIQHSDRKIYVREDDRKFYMKVDGKEVLMFDFGAKAGDRIVINEAPDDMRVMVVDSIHKVSLDNQVRDEFYVSYYLNDVPTHQEVWIEGIGSIYSFLFDNNIRWGGVGYSYFRYLYDSGTQYVYPEGSEVIDFSAVTSVGREMESLHLHRMGNILMAVFPAAEQGEAITLYDASGRVVAKQAIRAGATTAGIDASSLPAGIYIATLTSGASAKVAL